MSKVNKIFHKKTIIFLIAVAGALVAGGGFLYIQSNFSQNMACSNNDNRFFSKVASDFSSGDITRMKQDVSLVKSFTNYKNSQSCLYPLMAYYIKIDDSYRAEQYFHTVTKVYVDRRGLPGAYRSLGIRNLQDIRLQIQQYRDKKAQNVVEGVY